MNLILNLNFIYFKFKMIFIIFGYLAIFIKIILHSLKTIPRDLKGLGLRRRIDGLTQSWEKNALTVAKQFRINALKHPNKAAIIFENKTWTFQDVINKT